MKNFSKYAVPFAVTLTGLFFTVYTLAHYQLYDATMGPMQGALPTGIAALLTVFGAVSCLKARNSEAKPFDLRNWSVVAAVDALCGLSAVYFCVPVCVDEVQGTSVMENDDHRHRGDGSVCFRRVRVVDGDPVHAGDFV